MTGHGTIDGQPCRHMKTLVSAYFDGKLRGLARWYTHLHISGCPRCQAALEALRKLKDRLLQLKAESSGQTGTSLSVDRWNRIEAAWTESDTTSP